MLRKSALSFALSLSLFSPAFADSLGSAVGGTAANQSSMGGGVYNTSAPTLTSGQQVGLQVDVNGNLKTSASGAPSGTQDVNVKQQNGTTNATGNGTTTAGTQRVTISSDSTGSVASTVTPSATVGVSTQSCTVACASTLVSGAHALYGLTFNATLTGWILIYDAATCSGNGTVTPKKAYAYSVANTSIGVSWADVPMINATGIAACFSTTGPYTATASTTAFISVDYK